MLGDLPPSSKDTFNFNMEERQKTTFRLHTNPGLNRNLYLFQVALRRSLHNLPPGHRGSGECHLVDVRMCSECCTSDRAEGGNGVNHASWEPKSVFNRVTWIKYETPYASLTQLLLPVRKVSVSLTSVTSRMHAMLTYERSQWGQFGRLHHDSASGG